MSNMESSRTEEEEDEMKKFFCLCGFCHVRTGAIIIGLAEFLFITQTLIFVCSNMAVGNATYTGSNPVIGAVIKYNYLLPILVEQVIWLLTIVILLLGIKSMLPILVLPHFGFQVITIVFFVAFFIQFVINYANFQEHTSLNIRPNGNNLAKKATKSNDIAPAPAAIMAGLLFVALVEVYFANVTMMCYKFLIHEKVGVDAQKNITKSYAESASKFKLNSAFHHKVEPLRLGSADSDQILSQRPKPPQELSQFSINQPHIAAISGNIVQEPRPKQPPYLGPFSDSESELDNTLSSIPALVGIAGDESERRRTISEPAQLHCSNREGTSSPGQPEHHFENDIRQNGSPGIVSGNDPFFQSPSKAELENRANEQIQSVYDSFNTNGSSGHISISGQPSNPDSLFQRRPMTSLPPINLTNPYNPEQQQYHQHFNDHRVHDTDISDILAGQNQTQTHPALAGVMPRVGQAMHHTIISTSVQIERTDSISTIRGGSLSRINSVNSFEYHSDEYPAGNQLGFNSSSKSVECSDEASDTLEQLRNVPVQQPKVPIPRFSMDGAMFDPSDSGDDPGVRINVIAATPRRPSQTSSIL